MARVNIDSKAFGDGRFPRLAQLMSYQDRDTALGKMAKVWLETVERETYSLPAWLIDQHLGEGGSKALVSAELGEELEDGSIRIRGTAGRTEWLGDLRAMRQAGGKARAAGAKRGPNGQLLPAKPASRSSKVASKVDQHTSALTPVPALAPVPIPDSQKIKNSKKNTYTVDELASVKRVLEKLTARNHVAYQGSKEHVRLIVARLRDGCTEMDLRKVIGYCATELEWATKENMRAYLRPETLFGPETVQRYLDPARSWFDKIPVDVDGQRRAGATIHVLPTIDQPKPKNVLPSEAQALVEQARDAMLALFPAVEES